ncbi:MAG: hypothetical protein ACRCX2_18160 [Paraclostridium sp.]
MLERQNNIYDVISLVHGTKNEIEDNKNSLMPYEPVISTDTNELLFKDEQGNLVMVGANTVDTIDDLVQSSAYKLGDVIQVLGYYKKGDGAQHYRVLSTTDDGSGVLLANGLYANIVGSNFTFEINNTKEFNYYINLSTKISKNIKSNTFQIVLKIKNGIYEFDRTFAFRGIDLSNVSIVGESIDNVIFKINPSINRNMFLLFNTNIGEIANMTITYSDDTITSNHVGTGKDVSYNADENTVNCFALYSNSSISRMYNINITSRNKELISGTALLLGTFSKLPHMLNINTFGFRNGLTAYSGSSAYFGEGVGNGFNVNNSLVGINCHEGYVTGRNYNFTGDKTKEAVAIENNNGQVRVKWGTVDTNYVINALFGSITTYSVQGVGTTTFDTAVASDGLGNYVNTDLNFSNSNRGTIYDNIISTTSSFGKNGYIKYTGDGNGTRDINIPFVSSIRVYTGDYFVQCDKDGLGKILDVQANTYITVAFISVGTGNNSFVRLYNPKPSHSLNELGKEYILYYER